MIVKFISGLSGNGKKLFLVSLILIVMALFDRLLIGPTMSRMAAIDQDIIKEENNIKQDLHFLGYKDKIFKESEAVEPYVTKDIPGDEEVIAGFLKKLEMLASKANVTLIKVTPSPGVQDKDYIKYQADIECAGKLADVITFMHLVNTSSDLMKVTKFNFSSKKADSDELKAVMSVAKVIIGRRAVSVQFEADATSNTNTDKPAADATTAQAPK